MLDAVFNRIVSLRVLNLEHNSITFISNNAFNGTANFETFRLAYNTLISLPSNFADTMTVLNELSLSKNPWSCECTILHNLKEITYELADSITHRHDMYCFVNHSINASSEIGTMHNLIELDFHYVCQTRKVIHKNRTRENYTEDFCHTQIEALVSVIYKGFVVHELVPRLEKKEEYKLFLHFRDFPVGACIAETII